MVKNKIFVESVMEISGSTKTFLRIFDKKVKHKHLSWHQDSKDREVEILNKCKGWEFQYDDCIPTNLQLGDTFKITKETFHRLIKSSKSTDLILKIKERE